jgi:hypothetical protein
MFHHKLKQVLVWDPVTGDQRSLAVPLAFGTDKSPSPSPRGIPSTGQLLGMGVQFSSLI